MLPSKLEFVRKSYTPFVLEQLTNIGEVLSTLPPMTCAVSEWSIVVQMPRMLTSTESYQIRQELAAAGWGSVLKYYSHEREDLVIYLVTM